MSFESREEFLESIKRAAVEYLILEGDVAIAAMLVDATLETEDPEKFAAPDLYVGIPVAYAREFMVDLAVDPTSETLERALARQAIARVCKHQFTDWEGLTYRPEIQFRIKLSQPNPDWEAQTRALLTQGGGTNQGAISELVKQRRGEQMLTYHELKFASASEIRIAQELERRGVLFFPLAVGVVSETGVGYKDRREVDFLVCQDGAFGVLEVSYHPNRYEQDSEKNAWIKRHGVLCVEHYSAERCYNQSSDVVNEFLAVLARHKR